MNNSLTFNRGTRTNGIYTQKTSQGHIQFIDYPSNIFGYKLTEIDPDLGYAFKLSENESYTLIKLKINYFTVASRVVGNSQIIISLENYLTYFDVVGSGGSSGGGVGGNFVSKNGDTISGDLIYNSESSGTTDPLAHFSSRVATFRAFGNYINHGATDLGLGRVNGPIRAVDMRLFQESFITNFEPNTSIIFDNFEPTALSICQQAIADPTYVMPPIAQSPWIAFNYLRGAITVTTEGVAQDRTFWLRDFVRRFHRGTLFFVDDPNPNKRELVVIKNSQFALGDQFIAPFKYSHAKDTPLYVVRDMCWDLAADGTIIRPNSSSSVDFNVGAMYFGRFSRVGNTAIYGWTRHIGSMDFGHHIGPPFFSAFSSAKETNVPRMTFVSGDFKTWIEKDPFDPDVNLPYMYATGSYDTNTTGAVFTLFPQSTLIDTPFEKITVDSFVMLGSKASKDYQVVQVTAVNQTAKTFTCNLTMPTALFDPNPPVVGGIRIQPVKSSSSSATFVRDQLNVVLPIPAEDMAMFDISDWIWVGTPTGANGGVNTGKAKIIAKDTVNNTITCDRFYSANPTPPYKVSPYLTSLTVFQNSNVQIKSGNEFGFTCINTKGGSQAYMFGVDFKNEQVVVKRKISLQGISGDDGGFIFFDNLVGQNKRSMFNMNLDDTKFNFFLKASPDTGASFKALEINRQTGGLLYVDQINTITDATTTVATPAVAGEIEYDVTNDNFQINVACTSAITKVIINLPKQALKAGKSFVVKDVNNFCLAGEIVVRVKPTGGSIDGQSVYTLNTAYSSARFTFRQFENYGATAIYEQAGTSNIKTFTATDSNLTYTTTIADRTIVINTDALTGGNVNNCVINLVSTTVVPKGFEQEIVNDSANRLTLDANNTQTIDGFATFVSFAKGQVIKVKSDGTNWIVTNLKGFTTGRYTQTTNVVLGNSTTETNLIGAGLGSLTYSPNFFTVGKNIKLKMAGIYSTAPTPDTFNLKLKLDGADVATTTPFVFPVNQANKSYSIDIIATCMSTGATGTIQIEGNLIVEGSLGEGSGSAMIMYPIRALATIDTTSALGLVLTGKWNLVSTANTITNTISILETI